MQRVHKTLMLFIVLSPLVFHKLQAQAFAWKRYGVREGLTQSQISYIQEDKLGYLWLGTLGGGIVRFDGKHFESYTEEDGLPDNLVNSLNTDHLGNLWVTTSKGI